MAVEVIPSYKYCFIEAEKAIRYTEDASKWTPNNLRRLIISPDCVIAQFHVGVQPRQRLLNPEKYFECVSDEKYLKMTNALGGRAGTNICSHVEEIVYCLRGANNGALRQDESDWRAIISVEKASNSPEALIKAIGERFRRLRGFVIFNGTVQELMQCVRSDLSNPLYQISDDERMIKDGRFKFVDVHKSDWYKGSYFRPSVYPSDAEGGSLYKRLKSVENKMTAVANEFKKAENKDSAMKSLEDKFNTSYIRFMEVYTKYKQIALKMLKATNKSYLAVSYTGEFDVKHCSEAHGKIIADYFDLISDSMVEDLGRLGIKVSKTKAEMDRSAVQESIALLDVLSTFYYKSLVLNYLSFFVKLKETGKFDMFVNKFFNSAILIPQGEYLNNVNVSVLLDGQESFGSGKSISKSINIINDVLTSVGTRL